ncbi:hypothetical protein GT022_15675 [Agaribacter marinus]|uniref:Rad50/SbcC-type AAA domain-containing protein n=1 Tax=Virgibacillus salarius TaxID=447199 RepID=A0A941DYL0_9BACI|nr:hypothetical protein [Virgibacillus salarius]MBR7797474.1 hypothetical protein [Virgibacillus salarius]NAZ10184.1 hypothetical protein [Agaribacter marinus]
MIIRKLIVQGLSYRRTLCFSKDLNIISGEKTSGKSLVLSLIDYCFGKDRGISLKVQTELAEQVDDIFLELEINKEVFTICRSIKSKISSFFVYYCKFETINEYIPEKFDKKELQGFLMKKIGAMEFKKTKNKVRSNELTTETISFRDIYRYCFINQHDLGTHSFLSYNEPMKRYKNPISFEMIFDLVNFSQNELQTEIAKIQNQILENKKKKENLEGYLEQRGNLNYLELLDQIENYNSQIEELMQRKKEFINRQNEENKIAESNKDYILLNSEIHELDSEIEQKNKQIKDTQLGITSNKLLLRDYHAEMKDIKTTEEINFKLKINEHELTCPLCNSKIQNDVHQEEHQKQSSDNFKSILKDIENKIKMVNDVINTSKEKIEDLQLLISRKKRKKEILLLALNEFSKDVQTPFLPQLNSINVNINNLDKDREILLESKRVFNKIDELDKVIKSNEGHLDSLKEELKDMDVKRRKKSEIMRDLNKVYLSNMKKMKYYDTVGSYIDEEEYIPYYKNASVYEHESGGLLECMQISFLNAIVSSSFSKFHPQLLILDSISKYFGTNRTEQDTEGEDESIINDPEVYLNIYYMLVDLSKSAQVIVVENTPPDEMLQYEKYSFRNGEKGFIDLNKNEFLSE